MKPMIAIRMIFMGVGVGFLVVCIIAVLCLLSIGFLDFGYSLGTGFFAALALLG